MGLGGSGVHGSGQEHRWGTAMLLQSSLGRLTMGHVRERDRGTTVYTPTETAGHKWDTEFTETGHHREKMLLISREGT